MKKIAAVDIGTNSVLYSLFERAPGGKINEVHFERHSPRIGSKLKGHKKPVISADNYSRLLAILQRIIRHANRNKPAEILIAATSPLRLAKNGREVKKRLEIALGHRVAILSPDREAFLSYLGAAETIRKNKTTTIIDLGGGSTELAVYRGRDRLAFVSISEGAVSLTERFKSDKKIDSKRIPSYENYFRKLDGKVREIIPFMKNQAILIGGTSSILGYLKDSQMPVHKKGVELSVTDLEIFINILMRLNLSARRQLLDIDKKRAEIIFAGAFWLRHLFNILNVKSAIASPRGLRHGLALSYPS